MTYAEQIAETRKLAVISHDCHRDMLANVINSGSPDDFQVLSLRNTDALRRMAELLLRPGRVLDEASLAYALGLLAQEVSSADHDAQRLRAQNYRNLAATLKEG